MARHISEVEKIVISTIRIIDQSYPVKAAYLFGSYAKGTQTEDSDIDIAVFCDGIESLDIEALINFISNVQKKVGAEIELHLFPSSILDQTRPTNFIGYIVNNGKKFAA